MPLFPSKRPHSARASITTRSKLSAPAVVITAALVLPTIAHGKCDPLDGQVAFAEQCDDGNLDDGDACTNQCLWNVCGDGIACTGTGTAGSACGTDGPTIVEQCDKAAETALCDLDCTAAGCGDGYVNLTAGEECDDGNGKNDDGCKNDCHWGRDEQLLALDALKAASLVPVDVWFEDGIPTSVSMQVPIGAAADDAVAGALSFLTEYAALYRIGDPVTELFLDRVQPDPELTSVTFGQKVGSVPFRGGEIVVMLGPDREIVGTHGRWHPDLPAVPATPVLQAQDAEAIAAADVSTLSATRPYGQTRLMYYDTGFVQGEPSTPRLTWRVVLGGERKDNAALTVADYYVDAETGEVLTILDRTMHADFDLNTANNDSSSWCWDWPHDDPTVQWFTESGTTRSYPGRFPGADADGDAMWFQTNAAYDWWLRRHGRRSWDGSDEQVEVYVHATVPGGAAANDDCLKFSNGTVVPDMYGHEFAHGIDKETADLDYEFQSGAVAEAIADYFGVASAGYGNWYLFEGSSLPTVCTGGPAGSFRDMSDPSSCASVPNVSGGAAVPDPDHMSAFRNLPLSMDNGGVHTNSGILNRAFVLIADGGTHRGITIPPDLGRGLTEYYLYKVLRQRLGEESQIIDVRNEFLNAMLGVGEPRPPALMFSSTALCHVRNAFAAVGLAPTSLDTDCDGAPDQADPDSDNDGIPASMDNCDGIASADQSDADSDGVGDLCDPDEENDGICDNAESVSPGAPGAPGGCQRAARGRDNCPRLANFSQADFDNDGVGDACEDSDGDGINDVFDRCPALAGSLNTDNDGDGVGDICDPDSDDDGVCTDGGPVSPGPGTSLGCNAGPLRIDVCPNRFNSGSGQIDMDGDVLFCADPLSPGHRDFGCGNACDNCPAVYNETQADLDRDGRGDACDDDRDGDGVANAADNCPDARNSLQTDLDRDGLGTSCDSDDLHALIDSQGTLVRGIFEVGQARSALEMVLPACLEPACGSWLSPQIQRRLRLELPSPMRVQILDEDGRMVAKADADLNPVLRFTADPEWYYVAPSIVPIGAASAQRAARGAAAEPYMGKEYTLRILPGEDAVAGMPYALGVGSLQAARCSAEPVETCKVSMTPGRSPLTIKSSGRGTGKILWKVAEASASSPSDFGDPTSGGSYALCFYEEDGALPHLTGELLLSGGGRCGKNPCWKSLREGKTGQGWQFVDADGAGDGIRNVTLKSGADGRSSLLVKASGSDVPVPALPVMLPMRVQLQASNGACWQATYLPGSVETNDDGIFQAAGD